jgi:parallel beta-helix repeat protein
MKTKAIVLTLILGLLFSSLSGIGFVNLAYGNFIPITIPEHNIEIKGDGNVIGTDNIRRNGTSYRFTGDIFGAIVVFCDDIVIDGTGHTLQGNGTSTGFFLLGRNNITIRNVRISNFSMGIELVPNYQAPDNADYSILNTDFVLQGNTITNSEYGIYDLFVQDVSISKNTISNNNIGIFCWDSENMLVCKNNISSNGIGIKMLVCQGSVYQNEFVNNTSQIYSDGGIYGNAPSNIIWNNDKKGNYWSDYNGTDANGDGIGDNPHIFDVNYTDPYPLIERTPTPNPKNENPAVTDPQPFPAVLAIATLSASTVAIGLAIVFFKKHRH